MRCVGCIEDNTKLCVDTPRIFAQYCRAGSRRVTIRNDMVMSVLLPLAMQVLAEDTMPNRTESPAVKNLGEIFKKIASGSDDEHRTTLKAVEIIDEIPDEDCVRVLEKAIGRSHQRLVGAQSAIVHCKPREAVDSWIVAQMTNPDWHYAEYMLQTIRAERVTRFAETVNQLIADRSGHEEQIHTLIRIAGDLRTASNCAAIIRWVESLGTGVCPVSAVLALAKCRSETARMLLENAFCLETDGVTRVWAAWGLAHLGDARALRFLIDVLGDTDPETKNLSCVAATAARALSEMYNYRLDWSHQGPDDVRSRLDPAVIAAANAQVPSRYLSFVLFDNPDIDLNSALSVLKTHGCMVRHENGALAVNYRNGPTVYVSLAEGESIRRQAEIIACIGDRSSSSGDASTIIKSKSYRDCSLEALRICNRRFEISFNDYDAVLADFDTLPDVEIQLEKLTGGVPYVCWNGILGSLGIRISRLPTTERIHDLHILYPPI